MISVEWMLPIIGVTIGAVIGFVARRNHFCTLAALERHWYAGDSTGLRSWVLAAAVALLSTQILQAAGLINLGPSFYLTEPVPVVGALFGGFLFGVGMALVGTCGFGAVVRLGGGNLRALVVLTGIGLAALSAQRGLVAHFRSAVLDPLSVDLRTLGFATSGSPFAPQSGLSAALVATLIIGFALLYWTLRDAAFRRARGKVVSGVVIGLAIALGWVATWWAMRNSFSPIQMEAGSFVAPLGDGILQIITVTGALPDYGVGLVVGVFLGAAFCAWHGDDMRWEACDDARELSRHLLGAFLMGTGGVFALGCTIGQGVSAVSALALSAPIALVGIAFGARIGLAYLLEGSATAFLRAHRSEPAE